MIGFSESTVLGVPPQEAFDFLADPSTAHVIDPAVISYEPEGGTMGAGVRNRIRARAFGVPMRMVSETTAWEPGRRMTMESVRPARPFVAVATHTFEDHPDGTRYTWSMEFRPNTPGGGLLARLFCGFMRRDARAQGARFKRAVES